MLFPVPLWKISNEEKNLLELSEGRVLLEGIRERLGSSSTDAVAPQAVQSFEKKMSEIPHA